MSFDIVTESKRSELNPLLSDVARPIGRYKLPHAVKTGGGIS